MGPTFALVVNADCNLQTRGFRAGTEVSRALGAVGMRALAHRRRSGPSTRPLSGGSHRVEAIPGQQDHVIMIVTADAQLPAEPSRVVEAYREAARLAVALRLEGLNVHFSHDDGANQDLAALALCASGMTVYRV